MFFNTLLLTLIVVLFTVGLALGIYILGAFIYMTFVKPVVCKGKHSIEREHNK